MSYVSSKMDHAGGQMNAMFNAKYHAVDDARQEYANAQLAMAEASALLDSAFRNLNHAVAHLEYAVKDFSQLCKDKQIDDED